MNPTNPFQTINITINLQLGTSYDSDASPRSTLIELTENLGSTILQLPKDLGNINIYNQQTLLPNEGRGTQIWPFNQILGHKREDNGTMLQVK